MIILPTFAAMWPKLLREIQQGEFRAIARGISLVENEVEDYASLLRLLSGSANTSIIGVTGPPGAGKSTLVDLLIGKYVQQQAKVAVLCIDPSSPFHLGALLGDRIRMNAWYNHPQVFIRSLATRGALGGLHPKIIEITDLLREAAFNYIIIETVGVGQSEIEIVGLADVTVLVLVPESGDEIQTMKAGIMEIADVFVVNKADRPGADVFMTNLRHLLVHGTNEQQPRAIVKTIASEKKGIDELVEQIASCVKNHSPEKRSRLFTERAWEILRNKRMKDINKNELHQKIKSLLETGNFNLYEFLAHL